MHYGDRLETYFFLRSSHIQSKLNGKWVGYWRKVETEELVYISYPDLDDRLFGKWYLQAIQLYYTHIVHMELEMMYTYNVFTSI